MNRHLIGNMYKDPTLGLMTIFAVDYGATSGAYAQIVGNSSRQTYKLFLDNNDEVIGNPRPLSEQRLQDLAQDGEIHTD